MDITKEELDKKYSLGEISKDTYAAGIKNLEESDKVPFPNRSPASDAFEGRSVGLEPTTTDMNTAPGFTPTDPNLITKAPDVAQELANKDPNLFPTLAAEKEVAKELAPIDTERKPSNDLPLIQNDPNAPSGQPNMMDQLKSMMGGSGMQMSYSGISGMGGMPEVKNAYAEYAANQKEMGEGVKAMVEQEKLDTMALYETHKNVVEAQKKAAKANEDFQNASQIEPGRYWANASTGAKIGALLSAAFSGYAQAYTGGRNAGLDMITKLADDDLNAQVKNYNMLKEKGESANSLYSQMRAIYKDDEQAKLASRLAILHSTQIKMEMSKNKFAAASELQKLKNEMDKTAVSLKDAISKNAGLEAVALKYAFDPKSRFDDPKLQNPNYYLNRMKDGKVYSTEVGGHTFHATDDKNTQELRTGNVALNNMKDKILKLNELSKRPTSDLNARAMFDQTFMGLIGDLKKKDTLGTLDAGLIKYAMGRFSGLSYDSFTKNADKLSKDLINGLDSEFVNLANGLFSSGMRGNEYKTPGTPGKDLPPGSEALK